MARYCARFAIYFIGFAICSVFVTTPAFAQDPCSTCESCGEDVKMSEANPPGGLGNEMNLSCGECSIWGHPFCEAEASIRIDTARRAKLALQLGPNDVRVLQDVEGRDHVLGTVSLDLPPVGTTVQTLADLRVATSPSVCEASTTDPSITVEPSKKLPSAQRR